MEFTVYREIFAWTSSLEVLVCNDDYFIKATYNLNVFGKLRASLKLIDDMRETVIMNTSGLYKNIELET